MARISIAGWSDRAGGMTAHDADVQEQFLAYCTKHTGFVLPA
jgi:hypothetical protein